MPSQSRLMPPHATTLSCMSSTTTTAMTAARAMPFFHKAAVGGTATAFAIMWLVQRYYLRLFSSSIQNVHTEDDTKVTESLYGNLLQIAHIALPSWRYKEFAGSVVFILLFVVKAVLRVLLSKTNGGVLATMLHGRPSERVLRFIQAILIRSAVGLASGVTNGAIEWIRPWLIGCYRERLSRTFQRRFYTKLVYYQASVLDNRLEAADTVIATYCGEFAEHFAELPYYFVLPGLECVTSTWALVQQAGGRTAATMGGVVTALVLLLRTLSPQFGRIHALLLTREDDYRRTLGGDLSNVESIALHDAGDYACRELDVSLKKLKASLDHMALAKGNFVMLETAFSSFLSVFAYMVTFMSSRRSDFHRSINDIYLEIQLIENLNSSVKDFVVNFRELSHLTEFSTKMAEFDTTLNSVAAGSFVREELRADGSVIASTPLVYTNIQHVEPGDLDGSLVAMDDVLLQSPGGQVLFDKMNVQFRDDEDWVIIGENGCGKTSLLRMLTGLWLPTSGTLRLDKRIKYLMAPQHSFMASQCTLLEQICFPDRPPAATDIIRARVRESIDLAGAQTVVSVIGGYDSAKMGFNPADTDDSYDWGSLSGGQKQRISMSRVFFHVLCMDREKEVPVAILDEATSMMDDTEQDVINHLRRMNVRMISVTHREIVICHHSNVLRIKKGGVWSTECVRNQVPVGGRVEVSSDETV